MLTSDRRPKCPTYRKQGRAERLATLAHRADLLAAFLRDRRLQGEAMAAANLAEAIRAVQP